MPLNQRPAVGSKDDESNLALGQVLLVFDVLICGDEDLETSRFRRFQQIAIFQSAPAKLSRGIDGMLGKGLSKLFRYILIEQDARYAGPVLRKLG